MEWAGIPHVDLTLAGTGKKYQVNLQIYDADAQNNRTFVNRGNFGVRNNASGTTKRLTFDLHAHSHVFKQGHAIEVVFTGIDAINGDVHIIPFFETSMNTLSHNAIAMSSVILPFVKSGTTAVEKIAESVPSDFELSQNYPNPFNPRTNIKFVVPTSVGTGTTEVVTTIKVFDVLGREVATLVNEAMQPGSYTVSFDARSSALASGVYFYRLSVTGSRGSFSAVRKMILQR
jgi:hypothetical protein